jgi:hypothetical protein
MGFWVFWEGSKMVADEVQVVLAHMYEKWFFELVVWKFNKYVPIYGVASANHAIRHKSHMEKTMVICSSAFIPFNNNMEGGGSAYKLAFDPVGYIGKATKDAYL